MNNIQRKHFYKYRADKFTILQSQAMCGSDIYDKLNVTKVVVGLSRNIILKIIIPTVFQVQSQKYHDTIQPLSSPPQW